MRLKKLHINSSVPVDWKWPVNIGFIASLSPGQVLEELDGFHWLKHLAHGYMSSRVRNESNMLVFSGDLNKITKELVSNAYHLKTDLAAIFLEENLSTAEEYHESLEILTKIPTLHANSYFITEKPIGKSILAWLDEVIYQLSHNNALDKAIESTDWDGLLAITQLLIKESRVAAVMERLMDDIEKAKTLQNYHFDNVFNPEILGRLGSHSRGGDVPLNEKPEAIINAVKSNISRFQFDHESGESTTARDISTSHSSNISDMVDTIGADKRNKEKAGKNSLRFLQCVFVNGRNETPHHALLTNEAYDFKIKIDVPDQNWLQAGVISPEELPVKEGSEERVDILLRNGEKISWGHIMLPAIGSSDEAIFPIQIDTKGEQIFEIFAFHKTRLFQQVNVSVFFCQHPDEIAQNPGMKTQLINMPRTDLSDFDIKEKYGLTIVFTDGKPIIADEAGITEMTYESDIKTFNEAIKKTIEKYVKSNNPDDEDLILNLAKYGSLLYRNLFKTIGDLKKPIQIIADHTQHVPLEFIYLKELDENTLKLCPKASEALDNGQCESCNENEIKYICPFGFLCLQTIIERHRTGENTDLLKKKNTGIKQDVTLNRPAIPVLHKTLYGTSNKVEKVVAGLNAEIGQTLGEYSTETINADTWAVWKDGIKQDPDSLVIIGHVEPSPGGINDELEIGEDLKEKVFITEAYVNSGNTGIHPFLVLIGCGTQDLDLSFMDFAQHFKHCGAAIVLSTFTKIRGAHAGPLVQRLFEVLNQFKDREIPFGEAMLKLRQVLFAEKLYVSMAMVSHGDADWKLKIG